MKILLLSAYTAVSHQYWIDGLQTNLPEHDWTILSLPPRYFSWRIRGNSLTWAYSEKETLSQHYDLLLATSMVDLSALRGMVPSLASIPTLVYFHENQFAYPESTNDKHSRTAVEPQLLNLYTALCADQIAFNSAYNRDTFITGVDDLLKKLPDAVPSGLVEKLREKSQILSVPLSNELFERKEAVKREPFQLVWNHRWEFDKGPDLLLNCLQKIPATTDLKIHILGQKFRQQPDKFLQINQLLTDNNWLGEWGFVECREQYLQILDSADAVLSTALHDFQGLSVLEAYALDCVPIVPDRLAYREFIPAQYRYLSALDQPDREAGSAAKLIGQVIQNRRFQKSSRSSVQGLSWQVLKPAYQALFDRTINAVTHFPKQ